MLVSPRKVSNFCCPGSVMLLTPQNSNNIINFPQWCFFDQPWLLQQQDISLAGSQKLQVIFYIYIYIDTQYIYYICIHNHGSGKLARGKMSWVSMGIFQLAWLLKEEDIRVLHPWELTWNPKIVGLWMVLLFQGPFIWFHVNFPGCPIKHSSFQGDYNKLKH